MFKNTKKLEHLGRKRKRPRFKILENIHLQTDRAVIRQAVTLAYIKFFGQFSAIMIIARYLCTLTPPDPHWDMEFNTFRTTVHELCGCYPLISQLLGPQNYSMFMYSSCASAV